MHVYVDVLKCVCHDAPEFKVPSAYPRKFYPFHRTLDCLQPEQWGRCCDGLHNAEEHVDEERRLQTPQGGAGKGAQRAKTNATPRDMRRNTQ